MVVFQTIQLEFHIIAISLHPLCIHRQPEYIFLMQKPASYINISETVPTGTLPLVSEQNQINININGVIHT